MVDTAPRHAAGCRLRAGGCADDPSSIGGVVANEEVGGRY